MEVNTDRRALEINFNSLIDQLSEQIKTSLSTQDTRLCDPDRANLDRHETYTSNKAEMRLLDGLKKASLRIKQLQQIKTSLSVQDTCDPELHETSASNQVEEDIVRGLIKTSLYIKQLERSRIWGFKVVFE
jgi:hypothetical protein